MSLRDKLRQARRSGERSPRGMFERFGVIANPFPAASQTSGNPHCPQEEADELAETQIAAFVRDNRSQSLTVVGSQGVGKTNFLNFFEEQLTDVADELEGYYVVRYLADPENTFDGTIHKLLQELGAEHFARLAESLSEDQSAIRVARSQDLQTVLHRLAQTNESEDREEFVELMLAWLLGHRVLKLHREWLGVNFRQDTVEAKTATFRDVVEVSSEAGILKGIFLLLDELEKQDGVLGPRAVVRYLSAIRAIIDALPRGLFLMLAVTPDALLRYTTALPALRGRLENQVVLEALQDEEEAADLAEFYVNKAREKARDDRNRRGGEEQILSRSKIVKCFRRLWDKAEERGDAGVRQREFLNALHLQTEKELRRD